MISAMSQIRFFKPPVGLISQMRVSEALFSQCLREPLQLSSVSTYQILAAVSFFFHFPTDTSDKCAAQTGALNRDSAHFATVRAKVITLRETVRLISSNLQRVKHFFFFFCLFLSLVVKIGVFLDVMPSRKPELHPVVMFRWKTHPAKPRAG